MEEAKIARYISHIAHMYLDIIEAQQKEIEKWKKQATCGCGICLAHNNMICPKLKPLIKA